MQAAAQSSPPLRGALERLAKDDPDGDLAAAIRTSGHVLLPIAFDFTGAANRQPAALAGSAYEHFAASPIMPEFPSRSCFDIGAAAAHCGRCAGVRACQHRL